jgi:signal transduction histidine kinase/CheY-like chemotaxis protein/HPt (histidine-containing phosphotransfer) domain-containing protein
MLFLMIMTILMFAATYQSRTFTNSEINTLSHQKESISSIYLDFLDVKTRGNKLIARPEEAITSNIDSREANIEYNLKLIRENKTDKKKNIDNLIINFNRLFASYTGIEKSNLALIRTRDSLNTTIKRIEVITADFSSRKTNRALRKLINAHAGYLESPSVEGYEQWKLATDDFRYVTSQVDKIQLQLSIYIYLQLQESEIRQRLEKYINKFQTTSTQLDSTLVVLTKTINKEFVAKSSGNSYVFRNDQRNQLIFMLFAFLITISAMFYIIWNISSPIHRLLKLAKDVQQGNYDARFSFPMKSELATLGAAFNAMLNTLEQDRETIQKHQLELEDKVKQRTAELEKSKAVAEAASLAKSDFLAKMSHEIRTPMNGIIAATEVLSNTGINPQQKELVSIIHSSGSLLLNIINDILDFSKIESGTLELHNHHFSLRKLIDGTVSQFKLELAKKSLTLAVQIDRSLPDLYIGDKNKLKQILINLISNAIKFTQYGEIVFSIRANNTVYPIQEVHFAIADTGVGIPADKLQTVFDSFTQVDNSATREYGGTGLGTTISKKMVELMEGNIWAESPNPNLANAGGGPGTVFHFIIPLEQTDNYFFNLCNNSKVSIKDITLLVLTQSKELLMELSDIFSYNWIKPIHCNTIKEVTEAVGPILTQEKDIVILTDYHIYRQEHMEDILKLIRNSNLSFIAMIPNVISNNDSTLKSYGIHHIMTLPFKQSAFLEEITNILNERYNKIGQKQATAITNKIKKNPLKLLLAEDNPINQKVAIKIFETIGFSIDVANNGEEAVQKIVDTTYDLIFMDIQMPVLNGLDATKKIRELGNTTPIIAMTANAVTGDKEEFIAQGMSDYISKPITYNSITDMIKKWIFTDMSFNEEIVATNKVKSREDNMQYPVLNEVEAINRVYDKDLLKELLVDFSAMKELDWSAFEKHMANNEMNDIDRISHSIKGVAGNLALTGIYKTATMLNDSVKLGEVALLRRYFDELKLEVDRFRSFLPEYLQS